MSNNVSPLEEAALSGDTDRLYALIEEDPDMLNAVDAKPFVNTPLHIAASVDLRTNPDEELKYLYFATEIMMLKPSFALKLNPQGFSPIHLAVKNGHSKQARRLVDMKKELVRVKGREGNTPLHFASQLGECDLLAYFLSACPDSILDVNTRDETALHIAVRNQQFDALGVLIGWLKGNTRKGAASLERSILNRRDVAGNTILHLSVINHDIQALNLLINNPYMICLNAKNLEKKTVLDEAAGNADMVSKLSKSGARPGSSLEDDPNWGPAYRLISNSRHENWYATLTSIRRIRWNISDNQRDAYLVAAALFLTAIYQSALSPPGGLYQADGSNLNATSSLNSAAGKSVLSTDKFAFLTVINMLALAFAIMSFLFIIPTGMIGALLIAPTFYFGISYVYSVELITPPRETTRHLSAGQVTLLFVIIVSGLLITAGMTNLRVRAVAGLSPFTAINKYILRPILQMFRRSNNASNI
ncbi:hypothetical protein HN51_010105 [Arachis hypogaea]|uniref:PGG domain-containing protein n=1 Tax=Arachis hypogaea TaxID=3818 RepID=A0A445E451_ARAHY|nr:ankyrin repeat-containing protein BDA1-like [Arachis hypogaea]QHO55114.1 Ankyrin repeat-containing protein family [Arachis hypogaea]RYR70218.1 hypothetical protein Ahy_A03g016727 [Arachis hypogaea]